MQRPGGQIDIWSDVEAAEMTGNVVKIKLRSGSREIEIEASRQDVDELLSAWWPDHDLEPEASDPDGDEPKSERTPASPPEKKQIARKKPAARRSNTSAGQASGPVWSPNDLANKIKEHPNFGAVEKKVIHAENDFYNRAAFIISQADEPMSSGQVHKVLEALHVRVGLPRISTALSSNKRHFITSANERKHPRYVLTARAKAEVERWLLADGE